MEPLRGRVQRVQKVQKVQKVQRGRYRPAGDEYIISLREMENQTTALRV